MTRTSCDHRTLSFVSSAHATEVDYCRPTDQQRVAATTVQGVIPTSKTKRLRTEVKVDDQIVNSSSFPAPLVLPGDDLSLDSRYPPQSLRAWMRSKDRNEITQTKRVVYVAAPPSMDSDVRLMHDWSLPLAKNDNSQVLIPPETGAIIDYLGAFYDGMSVKPLPYKPSFVKWGTTASKGSRSKTQTSPRYVGLTTSTESVRIRTRQSADRVFARQLNLDDLLDAAISMLPEDAYALLMLVNQDLYEDEDDVFVCGRAYGGSRVAVVSTARYNPILDSLQNVDRQHTWPTSHCESYLNECCAGASRPPAHKQRQRKSRNRDVNNVNRNDRATSSNTVLPDVNLEQVAVTALQAAVSAHNALPSLVASPSSAALIGLWLGRVCRTTSHELGHCFGIDHCVYYACVMQGSSSLAEDGRQPPYLCPVDLAKLLRATGSSPELHYNALLQFCDKNGESHLFAAFSAWIRGRLKELECTYS